MVYGTIGAFAVFMVWLYFTSVLILIGAELMLKIKRVNYGKDFGLHY